MIGLIIRAMRPKQWLKNVLVFAAPGAAGVLDTPSDLVDTLIVFVAFCLAASGIYIWNDLTDIEADRVHPTKRHRPIAAGLVPVNTARVVGLVLPLASLAVAAATGRWQTVAIVGVYIGLTLCYTFWLKEVAIIDLLAVASGFVLRAAGGAVAVDVPMSRWFVMCITFGSFFIVVGKRYAELRAVGDGAGTRTTLDTYTADYLQMVLAVSCGGALISYCVWAFETSSDASSNLPWYELSIVPMLTALFRYLLVVERGEGAAPEEVFTSDRLLQLMGLAWVIIYGAAVYAS